MATYIGDKMVSLGVHKATDKVVLSKAEYDALEKKDPDTLYLVYDDHTLEEINEHIDNTDIHVTAEEKEQFLNAGHTDEEIITLAGTTSLKKELVLQSAVDITASSTSSSQVSKNVLITIPKSEMEDMIAVVIIFDGTISYTGGGKTSTKAYIDLGRVATTTTGMAEMFNIFTTPNNDYSNSYSANGKYVYTIFKNSSVLNINNAIENSFYYPQTYNSISSISYDTDLPLILMARATNASAILKGTLYAYTLKL